MKSLMRLRSFFRNLLRRNRADGDLDAEVHAHLELLTEEKLRDGLPPAAARRAALAFTNSYLDYTYGHATAKQLRDLSRELRAAITANPPRVPATIHALHPRIATLALTPHHPDWLADANVTDGQDTYQVISLVGRIHSEWLVVALTSAG